MKIKILLIAILFSSSSFGQEWNTSGLNGPGNGNTLGTSFTHIAPLDIYTRGVRRARFTINNSLNTAIIGNSGDGLRIFNQTPNGTAGNLDLYTSYNAGLNETHIVFGGNGQISGQGNRLELRANANGFYFNTQNNVNGVYKFSRSGSVFGYLGTNNFWRLGLQIGASPNANRRLEVVDNAWHFRISRTNGAFTDFKTRANENE